jgi:hypothetical protein
MGIQLKNNASGTLATTISASDTGITLTTGNGASFPALAAGDYFYATLGSTGGTQEIVKVTARSGDSMTIARAQESTTAQSFAAGSRLELRVTVQSVRDWAEVYTPAGTGAVPTTVQAKLREVASVKDFGAVGDGVTDDTTAIQNALNYLKSTGITLTFEPGKTYQVSQVAISQAGGNTRSNFRIEGNGALIRGTTSSAAFRIYRCQGLNLNGLRVQKHTSATYASDLDSFWFANFTECEFGETRLHADNNWGVYWNEFNGCGFGSLHFDLTDYTINQNVWKGGRVGAITKTDAQHPVFKEAYNNVFIGVDLLGAIDWRDTNSAFHDPIVLRDCNMEYTGVNYGYIIAEGGRSNPVNAVATRFFPEDDLRSEFNQQYSGSSWVTGWYPWSSTNLFRGGACQTFSPDISEVAVAGYLSIFADATSPTGNGFCYRLNFPGSSSARIRLRMPVEFLAQAKKVGYVTFSLWVYNVVGGLFIANTSGSVPSGDAYFTGYSLPANQWVQRFVSIPVGSSATDVSLYVGGSTITGFDVRVANICCTLGKVARPYTPAPDEPYPKRGRAFQKTLVANGSAQNTFTLTIPASNTSGTARIKATCNATDSVSIYTGLLSYARHNTGSQIAANIVEQGKAQSTYGGGTAGTIGAMAASAAGGTVTVSTTIVSYSGSPNRAVTYEVEFLDRDESLTVL